MRRSRCALAFYTRLFDTEPAKTRPGYAKQDKVWVDGAPNGERWEVYTVLEDSEVMGRDSACCA